MPRINGDIKLPAQGPLVLESHLATDQDKFAKGWPTNGSEGIAAHLSRSCAELKRLGLKVSEDCAEVYSNRYVKVWTPSEGGNIGQGSTSVKPSVACETWVMNMYWKKKPPMGTRFMIEANGKRVIACAGFETGPNSAKFIGGAQGEVFWYLGISNQTPVKMGRIDDQTLPYGPLECEVR